MTYVVGITGGIGSGKTQVTDILAGFGVTVVDADVVAREVVAPGTPALAAIAAHFGPQLLDADGHLQRSLLREIIFSDTQAKAWLEALLHPLIRTTTKAQLQASTGAYAVLASPLLLETDQHQLVDQVVVVDAQPQQQLQRASKRDNNSSAQIEAIMNKQLTRQERLHRADIVLDNSQPLSHLHARVAELHTQLNTLAEI
ncbi:MAG TPA: dephospho-CoA kinase [Oceanospirillaceae bacterium]|nr:dephospho-CoA kinase [Oceanospirillaceae bacterium]